MKKYRRNPKATRKDYSKFYRKFDEIGNRSFPISGNFAFYGLFIKNGRVHVDLKRMKKVGASGIPAKILDAASSIPRNTTYFLPARKKRDEYVTNRFRDAIEELRRDWNEMKQAFSCIQTPDEAGHNVYLDALGIGDYEYENAVEREALVKAKRMTPYRKLCIAFHANFIHQIASEMLAHMLKAAMLLGYNKKWADRSELHKQFNKHRNKSPRIQNLPHYKEYNAFYCVWNFLKHNSMNLFEEVQRQCPALLMTDHYQSGELSQYILKIDDDYIEQSLDHLKMFFDELCEAYFHEDPKEASWNYDEYFTQTISNLRTNP